MDVVKFGAVAGYQVHFDWLDVYVTWIYLLQLLGFSC